MIRFPMPIGRIFIHPAMAEGVRDKIPARRIFTAKELHARAGIASSALNFAVRDRRLKTAGDRDGLPTYLGQRVLNWLEDENIIAPERDPATATAEGGTA